MKKIYIKPSPPIDSTLTKEELLDSTKQHIRDVKMGLKHFIGLIEHNSIMHDHTKISHIDDFHKELKDGFRKSTKWWDMHTKTERHHLTKHMPEDVDLLDVLEMIVDGVMAGKSRNNNYRKEKIPNELLQTAYDNTIDKLLNIVEVNDYE